MLDRTSIPADVVPLLCAGKAGEAFTPWASPAVGGVRL